MKFQDEQIRAIRHKDGPMLALAGPGAGKTLVLTCRVKYLIEKYGIPPAQILVITFTKAAAGEMKERFQKMMGDVYAPVTFGTFHATFFYILRQAYHLTAANIAAEDKRTIFLREIVEKEELELDDENEFISGIGSEISAIKNEQIPLEHYYAKNCSEDVFRRIYERYENRLRQENLLDLDDLLVQCYELFKQRKDILQAWQQRYRYILVDEYQDINLIQYEVVKMLVGEKQNLFAVGDDDQSIYRFRGAKPEIMLGFQKDFPEAKMVLLDKNFRCPPDVVKAAGKVIQNNKNRYDKKLISTKEKSSPVLIRDFPDQREENTYIVKDIMEWKESGRSYEEVAVLFRTNIGPRQLIEKLMEYNVPFHTRDSIPNIYDHWIARNILAYIRMALGSREKRDFLQIMNRPKRYISRESVANGEFSFRNLMAFYSDKAWMQEKINRILYDLDFLSQQTPYTAIQYIRKGIGYEEYLHEYADYRRIKPEELVDILDELEESSKAYADYEAWFIHIEEYAETLKEQMKNKNIEGVTLATLHQSKGLEFAKVFIIDVNEGIIPHKKAVIDADIQEERRMFYVGMTRAMEYLTITTVKERFNKNLEPSRFIGELLLSRDELVEGAKVWHKLYRAGTIEKNQNGKLTVYFPLQRRRVVLDIEHCIANQILRIIEV